MLFPGRIYPRYALKWLAKIKLRGPGPLVVNILVKYCCSRVLLYAKMLKKLKLKKQGFFGTVLFLVAFRLGEGQAPWPPSYPYGGATLNIRSIQIKVE